MYIIVWKKYLQVIKILMKKAAGGDQMLSLNKTDFEKDKVARKSNVRFSFHIRNGVVHHSLAVSPIARELLAVLQEDPMTNSLLRNNEFVFSMTNRYELSIHIKSVEPEAEELTDAATPVVATTEDEAVPVAELSEAV